MTVISFDLDGVVIDQDLFSLRAINLTEDKAKRDELFSYYLIGRHMKLNPLDFVGLDDKLFLVTGRDESCREITQDWVRHYFPSAHLIMCNLETLTPTTDTVDWTKRQAELKAAVLRDIRANVYFEDNPEVVKHLRKLCPKITIIQYGGRFR